MTTNVKTNLANRALLQGGADPLTDWSENTPAGVAVRTFFDDLARALQEEHQFNCCATRLSIPADPLAPDFGYTYRYRKPVSCLRVWSVINEDDYPWRVEGDFILTHQEGPLKVRFGQYVDNPGDWDPLLRDLFAFELLDRIAPSVATDDRKVARARERLDELRERAQKTDTNEQEGKDPEVAERDGAWVEAFL